MPEFNVFQLILILGLVNGAILFISLSSLPGRFKEPAKILGFFILGYTAYISNWTIFASLGSAYNMTPFWIPSLYFLPALTFLFARSILSTHRLSRKDIPFFIPGILDAGYQLVKWVWYVVQYGEYRFPMQDRTEFFIYEGIGLLFAIFCVYKIVVLVRQASLKRNDAFIFYRYAFIFILFVLFRWFTVYFIDLLKPAWFTFELQFAFWSIDLVFFLLLGYRSLAAPGKYISRLAQAPQSHSTNAEILIKAIQSEKLYLNPDFDRKELAEKTGFSEVKISGIMTNELYTTFYELVNGMRAAEAKDLLEKGRADNLTMEAIASEAGFKSKTTFYKFFKKSFEMNPKSYLAGLK